MCKYFGHKILHYYKMIAYGMLTCTGDVFTGLEQIPFYPSKNQLKELLLNLLYDNLLISYCS